MSLLVGAYGSLLSRLRGQPPRVKEVGADGEFLVEFGNGSSGLKQLYRLGFELGGVAFAWLGFHWLGFWWFPA